MPQDVFKRCEIKYFLTHQQKQALLDWAKPFIQPDRFGRSTIRNLYYDTSDYRLVRRSNEKPIYKEKLRVRSYRSVLPTDEVFIEMKKKYRSVVFKRRMAIPEAEAMQFLSGDTPRQTPTQIAREIAYFCAFYGTLHPTVYLSYEREAFYARDDDAFRITFDENILSRTNCLSLCAEPFGTPLLPEGIVLLEVKAAGAIPMWLCSFLTENRIYRASFSKYGEAYRKIISKGELKYVG